MSARPTRKHNVGQAWRMVRIRGGWVLQLGGQEELPCVSDGIWEAAAPAGRVGDESRRPIGLPRRAEAAAAWGFQDEGVAGL